MADKFQFPCAIVRWVDDEPQPGWVEARFRDGLGREWVVFDKPPIFTAELLDSRSPYPQEGWITGEITSRRVLADGRVLACLQTMWAIEAEDGTSSFEIEEERLLPWAGHETEGAQ